MRLGEKGLLLGDGWTALHLFESVYGKPQNTKATFCYSFVLRDHHSGLSFTLDYLPDASPKGFVSSDGIGPATFCLSNKYEYRHTKCNDNK